MKKKRRNEEIIDRVVEERQIGEIKEYDNGRGIYTRVGETTRF